MAIMLEYMMSEIWRSTLYGYHVGVHCEWRGHCGAT